MTRGYSSETGASHDLDHDGSVVARRGLPGRRRSGNGRSGDADIRRRRRECDSVSTRTAKVEPGANCVVFGLGGIGLNVIQGLRLVEADVIVGVDLNPARRPLAERFGMTHFVNPKEVEGDLVPCLVDLTKGGADYSFECIGNVATGVFGHSMGGHGALTIALKNPGAYRTVSAFAPICAPAECPWGEKAFRGYLGEDRAGWAEYDAVALIRSGARTSPILVDQGEADPFLDEQLHPHLLEEACARADQPLELRRHPGCDHGYYFIQTFMADHLEHHARGLGG